MALDHDIGGAPTVRAVLDAFYSRVLADPTLSAFFLGVDIERLKKTQEAYFAMALGGPNTYTGRTLHHAHLRTRQRGATDDVFDRYIWVFKGVLVDLGIPHGKIHKWLAVLENARGQILNRENSHASDETGSDVLPLANDGDTVAAGNARLSRPHQPAEGRTP
jgi:hemoglobin